MSQFCQVFQESDGLKIGTVYQVNQVFTKKNGHLYKGRRICELANNDADCGKKIITVKAKFGGVVGQLLIKLGDVVSVGQSILEIEACTHPTTLGNICCDCGVILEDKGSEQEESITNGLVSMLHSIPDLKVSKEEAKRLGTEDINNLLENHKLVLLVDLDQTLIHTTNDNIPPKLKDVFHFQLVHNGPWYHTRLRPYATKFLQNMTKYYELHICTFGVREYAHCIAHFLDKDHKLFGDRILSRNECLDPMSKKANLSSLFPCGDNLVCIIDDRSDVWNYAPNVVQVMPYHFFQHTGDINAPPGLQKKEDDESKGYDFTKLGLNQDRKPKEDKVEFTKAESLEESLDDIKESTLDNGAFDLKRKRSSVSEDDSLNKKSKTSIPSENLVVSKEINLLQQSSGVEKSLQLESSCIDKSVENSKSPISSNISMLEEDTKLLHSDDESKLENNSKSLISTNTFVLGDNSTPLSKVLPISEVLPVTNIETLEVESKLQISSDIPSSESSVKSELLLKSCEVKETSDLRIDCDENIHLACHKSLDVDYSSEGSDNEKTESFAVGSILKAALSSPKSETMEESSQKDLVVCQKENSDVIDVEDSDDYLLYLEDILKKLHDNFYSIYDKDKKNKLPDLKQLVPETRKKVLKGANLVFSGVIPRKTNLRMSKAFYIASSLGANVTDNIIYKKEDESNSADYTTHVIAANQHTEKVHIARKSKHIKIVTPNWLWCCAERWERVDERLFTLDNETEKTLCRNPPIHCCINVNCNRVPQLSSKTIFVPEDKPSDRTDSQKLIDSLNPLAYLSDDDAKSMEQEVDGELSDDDENDAPDTKEDNNETESEESDESNDGSSKNNSDIDEYDGDNSTKRRHSRTGINDDDDEEDEDVEEEEDELPSVKFRQGGSISGDESDNEDDDDMNAYGDILAKELMD